MPHPRVQRTEPPDWISYGQDTIGSDLARALPPSEVAEVVADEVRNPAIRDGDVLLPVSGRRLIARVATGKDVEAYLSSSVLLIRTDPVTVDPWFLAGILSSSDGGNQATRMASTLGEYIASNRAVCASHCCRSARSASTVQPSSGYGISPGRSVRPMTWGSISSVT
jgi:hypothetical protein